MFTLGCFWCPPCKAAAQPVMDILPLLCPLLPPLFLALSSALTYFRPACLPLCNRPLSQGLYVTKSPRAPIPTLTAPTSASPVRYNPSQLAGPSLKRNVGRGAGEREWEGPHSIGGWRSLPAGRSSGGAGSAGGSPGPWPVRRLKWAFCASTPTSIKRPEEHWNCTLEIYYENRSQVVLPHTLKKKW